MAWIPKEVYHLNQIPDIIMQCILTVEINHKRATKSSLLTVTTKNVLAPGHRNYNCFAYK